MAATYPTETLGRDDGLATYPFPFRADSYQIVQIWPKRLTRDPAHKWLRAQVSACVSD